MIILIIWITGIIIGYLPITHGLVKTWVDDMESGLETADYVLLSLIGLVLSAFWPIIILGYALSHLVNHSYDGIKK